MDNVLLDCMLKLKDNKCSDREEFIKSYFLAAFDDQIQECRRVFGRDSLPGSFTVRVGYKED